MIIILVLLLNNAIPRRGLINATSIPLRGAHKTIKAMIEINEKTGYDDIPTHHVGDKYYVKGFGVIECQLEDVKLHNGCSNCCLQPTNGNSISTHFACSLMKCIEHFKRCNENIVFVRLTAVNNGIRRKD